MELSRNLKLARIEKGLTQAQLAESAGVKREQIAKYEAGTTLPNLVTGVRIARRLETTVEILVGIEDESEANPQLEN